MANSIKKLIVLTLFTLTGVSANVAAGNEYAKVDRLALEIQAAASQLVNETIHYRHTPNYGQLVQDGVQLEKLAIHLHELVLYEVNIYKVEADLAQLDQTFHHLVGLLDATELQASRGRGVIKGNTAHVKQLMNQIENCIYQLQEDVARIRRRTGYSGSRIQVVTQRKVVVPKPVYKKAYKPVYPKQVYTRPTYNKGYAPAKVAKVAKVGKGGIKIQVGSSGRSSNKRVANVRGKSVKGKNIKVKSTPQRSASRGRGFSIGGGSSKIRIKF